MARYIASVLGLAATCYAQQDLANPLSTDLTIALYDARQASCDISNAPTLHITGFRNTSIECFAPGVWSNNLSGYEANSSAATANFTLLNADKYSNTTFYSGLYYQQLSGNTTQDQAGSALGRLRVQAYPCPNCATSCNDEGTGVSGAGYSTDSNLTVGPGEWLQWDCYHEGGCYQAPYDIKSFWIGTAVDKFDSVDAAEQYNKCELAAVSSTNITNNNNTATAHSGASKESRSSIETVLIVVGLIVSILEGV